MVIDGRLVVTEAVAFAERLLVLGVPLPSRSPVSSGLPVGIVVVRAVALLLMVLPKAVAGSTMAV